MILGDERMQAQRPFVSVIVVTHSRPQFLARCLQSIAAQSWADRELVVVLNPADKASESIARSSGAGIVRTHKNIGYFPAANLGIANSDGNLIMLVDDDAELIGAEVLARLVEVLLSAPETLVVTCNLRGPCEAPPFASSRRIFNFKSGFALYKRELFSEIAGYFPDLFFRDAGELFLANRIYEFGGVVAVAHDAWMSHAQTSQGRYRREVNFHAVRSHALLSVMQEPLAVVPLSLAAKVASTLYRIALQRRDPLAWFLGWVSFAAHVPEAARQRRAISLRTYLYTRRLRREAEQGGHLGTRPSAESGSGAGGVGSELTIALREP